MVAECLARFEDAFLRERKISYRFIARRLLYGLLVKVQHLAVTLADHPSRPAIGRHRHAVDDVRVHALARGAHFGALLEIQNDDAPNFPLVFVATAAGAELGREHMR